MYKLYLSLVQKCLEHFFCKLKFSLVIRMSLILVISKKIIDFLNFNSIDPITIFRLEFGKKKCSTTLS